MENNFSGYDRVDAKILQLDLYTSNTSNLLTNKFTESSTGFNNNLNNISNFIGHLLA